MSVRATASARRLGLARPRLLATVADADAAVVTVFAPAGAGKTTLAAQLAAEWGGPVSWLDVDEHDRDERRLARAIDGATDGALRWVDGRLEVAEGAPRLVVIDDAHHLAGSGGGAIIGAVGRRLPPGWRLIVAGRWSDGLALAALDVAPDTVALTGQDLRFRVEEVERLVATEWASPLTSDEVVALTATTGGWAAALRLVGRVVGAHPGESTAVLADPWQACPGLRRYVAEEVVAPLGDELVEGARWVARRGVVRADQPDWGRGPEQPSDAPPGAVELLHDRGLLCSTGTAGELALHPFLARAVGIAVPDPELAPTPTGHPAPDPAPGGDPVDDERARSRPSLVPVPDPVPESGDAPDEPLLLLTGRFRLGRLGDECDDLRPQHLAILQALALRAPGWVARDQLLVWFWPEADPAAGNRRLATAISAIRRVLEAGAPTVSIIRHNDRFRLDTGDTRSDLAVLRSRLADAEAALRGEGSLTAAIRVIESCLDLQRGPVLGAACSATWVDDARWELDERWERAVEALLDRGSARPRSRLLHLLPRLLALASRSDRQWLRAIEMAEAASAPLVASQLRARYERLVVQVGA